MKEDQHPTPHGLPIPLPVEVWLAIEAGPNDAERFNDEWKRRELFALRIAKLAYEAGRASAPPGIAPSIESALLDDFAASYPGGKLGDRYRALKNAAPQASSDGGQAAGDTVRPQPAVAAPSQSDKLVPPFSVSGPPGWRCVVDTTNRALTEYEIVAALNRSQP